MGRRSLNATPPLGVVLEETRTTRAVPVSQSVGAKLTAEFQHKDKMGIRKFVEIAWGIDEISGIAIKKSAPGAGGMFSGTLETIPKGDKAPEDVEVYLHETFRPGKFVLSPVVNGFHVQSQHFMVGTLEELEAAGYTATASASHAATTDPMLDIKRKLAERMDLKLAQDLLGENEMKPADIAALATAFRPPASDGGGETMKVVMQLLIAQQERSDKLMAILVEKLGQPAASPVAPSVLEKVIDIIGKKLTPDSIRELLTGRRETEDAGGWKPSDVLTIVQAAGPVLGQVMGALGGAFRVAPNGQPALTEGQPVETATPAPTGGAPVQYDLDSDEKEALDQILAWIKDKDYRSAWAMLQASAPRLCMLAINLDPEANALAYLPFLKACSLKCRQPDTQADLLAWIGWCQEEKRRVMALSKDDEAE